MQKKISFKNSKGQRLVGVLHIPSGKGPFPIVIICHGLGGTAKDSKNRIQLSKNLNKEKIAAFRFDFNGHGESQGRFADVTVSKGIDDLKSAIKFLKNNEPSSPDKKGSIILSG